MKDVKMLNYGDTLIVGSDKGSYTYIITVDKFHDLQTEKILHIRRKK